MNSKIQSLLAGGLLCLVGAFASNSHAVDFAAEYAKQVKSAEAVGTLGPDAFGDSTNFYTGSTEFNVTDVSLPGNNALPVRIGRRFVVGDNLPSPLARPFADWDLDIPYLQGIFSNQGWQTGAGDPNQRCSVNGPIAVPPPATAQQGVWFYGDEYWSGNTLYVPGSGSQEMLNTLVANQKPTDGKTYYWVTNNQWHFSCLPTTANGVAGEGFLAVAPDGTRTWFNWVVSRQAAALTRPAPGPMFAKAAGGAGAAEADAKDGGAVEAAAAAGNPPLPRKEVRIFPTRVEDRFGNSVTYTYDPANPWRLTQISSSDDRILTLTYNASGTISTVSDGTRTWSYSYGPALATVTLPDNSQWIYEFGQLPFASPVVTEVPLTCHTMGEIVSYPYTGAVTHPSGLRAEFVFDGVRHGRSYVSRWCIYTHYPDAGYAQYAPWYDTAALIKKTISGPGIASAVWQYTYGAPNASYSDECASGCATTKTVAVSGPSNEYTRYTFGNKFFDNEGKLLKVERGSGPSALLTAEDTSYLLSTSNQNYPAQVGVSPHLKGDRSGEKRQPAISRVTNQQGVDFSWTVPHVNGTYAFDLYGNTTKVDRASSGGTGGSSSRTETTVYTHSTAKWVIGQVATVTDLATGKVIEQTEYNTARSPWKTYRFGVLQQTLTYNADGTLATVKDGLNNTTTASSWYRGIPRNIGYQGGATESAVVNPTGTLANATDELGFTTAYGYDDLGRLTNISPPTGDTVVWNDTTRSFTRILADEYGIGPGHWKQTVQTGSAATGYGRTTTFYDAYWRPVLTLTEDTANAASRSFVVKRFDDGGREIFRSYPVGSLTTVNDTLNGVTTSYDALGRPTQVQQHSELGLLTTSTAYLLGFVTRVTNPRGFVTETAYQLFDSPSTESPVNIVAAKGTAEQQTTVITRDGFGKPTLLARSGTYGGSTVSADRKYVYDTNERLCKTIQPENGAGVVDYDAAGNLKWTADGTTLTTLTCNRTSVTAGQKTTRTYDGRNRVTAVATPGGTANLTTTYYADGAVNTLTAANPGGFNVVTSYSYNKRRLLTGETSTNGTPSFSLSYGYNANGHLSALGYPDTEIVTYSPDNLGRATLIAGNTDTYASAISYYPSGAISSFKYGAAIGAGPTHTMTPNLRGLPMRSQDVGGTVVLDDTYEYDANGNVTDITDQAQAGLTTRGMGYDPLDRLTAAVAPGLWGNGTYAYDPLDNLRIADQGTRQYRYNYDAAKNRLLDIKNPAGVTQFAFTHDARGNVLSKGTSSYVFDSANRMSQVTGSQTYRYDGQGRRVQTQDADGKTTAWIYSQSGQVLYTSEARRGQNLAYIYLGNTQVATRAELWATPYTVTVRYQMTDALGSPAASTNTAGGDIKRTSYTPWGESTPGVDGTGYTGHVMDQATGLTYMQQRYYDPQIGRFLSTDPMDVDEDNAWNFNRYAYADNNPYIYVDPDGRARRWVALWQIIKTLRPKSAPKPMPLSKALPKPARDPSKKVPSPNGKKGGEQHQRKVDEVEAEVRSRGLEPVRERKVDTPDGEKGRRHVDVSGIDPKTGRPVESHQVGRGTKGGAPVARERRAIVDLETAEPEVPVYYHRYDTPPP